MRYLMARLGSPTNKHIQSNVSVMQEKNLDDILRDADVREFLGEDAWRYFDVLLANRKGLNFRNRMAHGLMTTGEMNRSTSNRVVHALLVLALIRPVHDDHVEVKS